jgi:hypothetical protein
MNPWARGEMVSFLFNDLAARGELVPLAFNDLAGML